MEKPLISLSKTPRAASAEARMNSAASKTLTRSLPPGAGVPGLRSPPRPEKSHPVTLLLPRVRRGRGQCQRGQFLCRDVRVGGGAFGYSARRAVAAQTLAAARDPPPHFRPLVSL